MPISNNILAGSGQSGTDLGEPIEQSLRFTGAQKLSKTGNDTSTGSTSGTISVWYKVGKVDSSSLQTILVCGDSSSRQLNATYNSSDFRVPSCGTTEYASRGPLRDPSAWYHIVTSWDSSNTDAWINGVHQGTKSTTQSDVLRASEFFIGDADYAPSPQFFHGYLAEFYAVEGTKLDHEDFGRYNNDGVWVPIAPTISSYGTNGFHLTFDSSQDANPAVGIGIDSSGNNNHFTASGFDTTAISSSNFDNDIDYNDTPTSNYGTANPVGTTVSSFTEANLFVDTASNGTWQAAYGTFPMQSGKWYWEVEPNQTDMMIGISSNHRANPTYASQTGEIAYRGQDGRKWKDGVNTAYGGTYTTGDVVGIAFDADNGTIWFSVNGTWQNSATQAEIEAGTTTNAAFSSLADGIYVPAHFNVDTGGQRLNYGQRVFEGTKPSGYEALNTNKLAEPTVKNGSDHFRVLTGTGANILGIAQGTNTNGTNWNDDVDTGFANAMYLIKDTVNNSTRYQMFNSISGTSLVSDFPAVRASQTYSTPSGNSVAWVWSAPDTFTGTTNTTCRQNSDAGFTIVDSGSNVLSPTSYSHGLGQIPDWMIFKNHAAQNIAVVWPTFNSNRVLTLDSDGIGQTANLGSGTGWFGGFTSTTVTMNSYVNTNPFMAYHWKEVEGYSKFGRFVGNGSADGPFVYTGFRVAWLLLKADASSQVWRLYDSTRHDTNVMNQPMVPNYQNAEIAPEGHGGVDFLSNGFKIRSSNNGLNLLSTNIMYACFAENPFGGENAPPATAR